MDVSTDERAASDTHLGSLPRGLLLLLLALDRGHDLDLRRRPLLALLRLPLVQDAHAELDAVLRGRKGWSREIIPSECGAIGSDRIGDRIVGRDAKNVDETRVSMREGVDAIDNGRWGGIRRTWCCSLACAEGGKRTREEADVSGARDLAGVKKPRRIGRGDALARAREANPPRGGRGNDARSTEEKMRAGKEGRRTSYALRSCPRPMSSCTTR